LDGQCKTTDPQRILGVLLNDWTKCNTKDVLHVLGNHELYCFEKKEAAKLFGLTVWNYSFVPAVGWKIIVLDSYYVTTLDKDTEAEAHSLLANHNPNNTRSQQVDWLKGLTGEERRFVPYNGAVGKEQLEWLRKELDSEGDTKVIVATHVPLMPGSCCSETLAWDYEGKQRRKQKRNRGRIEEKIKREEKEEDVIVVFLFFLFKLVGQRCWQCCTAVVPALLRCLRATITTEDTSSTKRAKYITSRCPRPWFVQTR
jgi:hypothetical protein